MNVKNRLVDNIQFREYVLLRFIIYGIIIVLRFVNVDFSIQRNPA